MAGEELSGETAAPNPGRKAHLGWFAVPEEGLRVIERAFDDECSRRKAKAAYTTLLRIANLEGEASFRRPITSIARDMDYSPRHAAEAIELLVAVGLCRVQNNFVPGSGFRAPSTYTIEPTLQNGIAPFQNGSALLPASENPEGGNSSKNFPKNAPKTPPITSFTFPKGA